MPLWKNGTFIEDAWQVVADDAPVPADAAVVLSLKPGLMLYSTGDKVGIWWKVSDELGNVGWVLSSKLELAH